IKAENPAALFYGGTYTEGALILRQARDAGIGALFLTGENSFDPEFVRMAGPAAEGAYVTYLGRPPELLDTAKAFVDKYKLRYPGQEIKAYDHYGYEITNMLLEALEKVGPDKAKIIEYLRGLRYTGVLGETTFDEKGDTRNRTITLFVIKKGVFTPSL
ncbi:MAG TPA: branched-chain amino acid ABC transporter substrate-binding protein, partial [Elusimicrobiota bacterium]|nr:branched-chain amino acid ABC transporter substrate-binding protein [Elusimicrobiota bacterium]